MRTYKRNTNRGSIPKDVIDRACQQVIFDKKSINSTAKEFDIPYKTLQRYVVNMTKQLEETSKLSKPESNLKSVGYRKNRQIFSDEEELALESYLKKAADIYYGLTPYETKGKGKRTLCNANKKKINDDESDEDETFCLECTESYRSSIEGEDWIQCTACKLWAHTKCVNKNILFYECKNCTSDLEASLACMISNCYQIINVITLVKYDYLLPNG